MNNRATLLDRERAVLLARLDGQTLDRVARDLNVTRERVRQIESAALYKLLHHENPAISGRLAVVIRSLLTLT